MKGKGFVSMAVAVFLCFAVFGFAQEKPARYMEVINVKIKPGTAQQYEEYIKKAVEAYDKVNASQYWGFWQLGMGAEYDMYMAGLPFNEWGEIDNWSEKVLIEAFGEEEAAKIQRMRTASVLHVETMVFERVDRLSTVTEVRPPTKFVSIAEMHVKPSKVVAFQLLLGKGKAAREKAPDAPPYSVGRVALGNAHTYVMATGFDSFAERDKWPDTLELMGKAYGEEEARQMLKTYLDSIESRRDYIAIFRPDLSRAKPQAATN